MDILNGFRQLVLDHWSGLELEGLRIELHGAALQQTVKTNNLWLYTSDNRYEAQATIWDFGNCDFTIADMGAASSVPMDEAIKTISFENIDSHEVLNAMMESILTAFRDVANIP